MSTTPGPDAPMGEAWWRETAQLRLERAVAAEGRIAELERMLEHEVERYLHQLMLRERAEATAGQIGRQLHGQVRGNAKLLAQLKAQGAVLRSRGVEDRPINFPEGQL